MQRRRQQTTDTLPPGKAGGAVAVRRTLATTICQMVDPTQVPRPRQLRDASTVMRLQPAHQSMINRRYDDRTSCSARHSIKHPLEIKPRIRTPATCKGGHESGENLTLGTRFGRQLATRLSRSRRVLRTACMGQIRAYRGARATRGVRALRVPRRHRNQGAESGHQEATTHRFGSRPERLCCTNP